MLISSTKTVNNFVLILCSNIHNLTLKSSYLGLLQKSWISDNPGKKWMKHLTQNATNILKPHPPGQCWWKIDLKLCTKARELQKMQQNVFSLSISTLFGGEGLQAVKWYILESVSLVFAKIVWKTIKGKTLEVCHFS